MSEDITIELPELPEDEYFEEFIASYLQADGQYVETNIEDPNILELDLIVTNYDEKNYPIIKLIEVKSGKWKFSDIFKVRGWIEFTDVDEGKFIVQNDRELFDLYQEKARSIDINLIHIPDPTDQEDTYFQLSHLLIHNELSDFDPLDVKTFRYSHLLERSIINQNQLLKKFTDLTFPQSIKQYYDQVTSGTFFNINLIDRLQFLYDSFKEASHLTKKTASEISGDSYELIPDRIPTEIFNTTFYDCAFTPLNISTYAEFMGRIAILKNTVDLILYRRESVDEKIDHIQQQVGEIILSKYDSLPENYLAALDELETHEYLTRYPLFWQWFIYVFGGFIINDDNYNDWNLLSEKTGIPVHHMDEALEAFDILFPLSNSWFIDDEPQNIKIMRMYPVPLRGLGVYYRMNKYDHDKVSDFNLHRYALQDMSRWNNLAVNIINESLSNNMIPYEENISS